MRTFLVIALLIVFGVVIAHTRSKEPHVFSDKECYNCHIDPNKFPGVLKAPVSDLCSCCHSEIKAGESHPYDVEPHAASVPSDLPLTDGKVTCNTCHFVHSSPTLAFGIDSHFLRRQVTNVKDFCVACHVDDISNPGHKELFIVAHEANKYVVTDPDDPIDPLSVTCIGCHDGSVGPAAEYSLGGGVWQHSNELAKGHPIGVDYSEARMRGKSLKPVYEIDKKVRLFDGKVGCASCHDWFKTENHRVVLDMKASGLCYECHYI